MTCGATKTPMWRTNTDGLKTLCNACGVRLHREQKKARANLALQASADAAAAAAASTDTDSPISLRSRSSFGFPALEVLFCLAAEPGCRCLCPGMVPSVDDGTVRMRAWLVRHAAERLRAAACVLQERHSATGERLSRKRVSMDAGSPRAKASRTQSMPEPGVGTEQHASAASWIMHQLQVRARDEHSFLALLCGMHAHVMQHTCMLTPFSCWCARRLRWRAHSARMRCPALHSLAAPGGSPTRLRR